MEIKPVNPKRNQSWIFIGKTDTIAELQYFDHPAERGSTAACCKISNQSTLKEISPGCSLEGLMLKLKLQYFGPSDAESWLTWKDPDAEKDWGQEEKGTTEDEVYVNTFTEC